MTLSKEVEAALSVYGQLSARLATALNTRTKAEIPVAVKPTDSLLLSVNRLDALLQSFRKHGSPPALWSIAGLPIEVFMLSDVVEFLESGTAAPCGSSHGGAVQVIIADADSAAITDNFVHQQKCVVQWFKGLILPRDRRNQHRDAEIARLSREGKSWDEIGRQLDIEPTTAKQAMQRLPKDQRPPKRKPGRPKRKTKR